VNYVAKNTSHILWAIGLPTVHDYTSTTYQHQHQHLLLTIASYNIWIE